MDLHKREGSMYSIIFNDKRQQLCMIEGFPTLASVLTNFFVGWLQSAGLEVVILKDLSSE